MRGRGCAILASLIAGLAIGVTNAAADVYKPTRFGDPAPNGCSADDCSLREAIIRAENHPGRDTVVLAKGTYRLQIPVTNSDLTLATGDLNISTGMTIRGQGPSATVIDANGIDRSFFLSAYADSVTLRDLKVTGGDAGAVNDHANDGGGILAVDGTQILNHVVVSGNRAFYGGGIESYSSDLELKSSTIAGNVASEGAGIDLRAFTPAPSTTIRASTIAHNHANTSEGGVGKGGGILADGYHTGGESPPKLDMSNSTVAENTATAEAGGVMLDNSAMVEAFYSTFTDNTADADNAGGGNGGGVYQHTSGNLSLYYSILARNHVGSSGAGPECGGTVLVTYIALQNDSGSACNIVSATGVTVYGPDDLQLGTLADNGGPTKTIKLLPGDAAIGKGNNACPKKDQRGQPRPDVDCDVGAFERQG